MGISRRLFPKRVPGLEQTPREVVAAPNLTRAQEVSGQRSQAHGGILGECPVLGQELDWTIPAVIPCAPSPTPIPGGRAAEGGS